MTGSGTQSSPYKIYSLLDLQAMENDLSAYYELANDIDAFLTLLWNGGLGFDPIGIRWSLDPFDGQLDGKDYTISNLFIDRPLENFVGLFSGTFPTVDTPGGILKNIKLTDADITGEAIVGVLVGSAHGDFENCSSSGSVTGESGVGGLCGTIYGDYERSSSTCVVSGTGAASLDVSIGGFAGYIGGDGRKSFATGNVTATLPQYVGGFGGVVNGEVDDCYSRGDVTGGEHVGGFCGLAGVSSNIDNSYSAGAVSGDTDVGGFCGKNTGTISPQCFWDKGTSGQASSDGGTGKTTSQMKTKSTFTDADWDFVLVWGITALINDGYPFLRPLGVRYFAWII